MSRRKTERLFNLTVALLSARRYLSKDELRKTVVGYDQTSTEAFERQLERDKEELRSMGINVVTGSNHPLFEDEVGYRIARSDFELAEMEFSAAEVAVLAVAARAWEQSLISQTTQTAWTKLQAAGIEPDRDRLLAVVPQVVAREPAFDPLWHALSTQHQVRFTYRDEIRTVDPWRLVSRKGAWYLIGFDHLRQGSRAYKLARISDRPRLVTGKDPYQPPSEAEIEAHLERLNPAEATLTALVGVVSNGAPELRRRARYVSTDGGFDIYEVPYATESDLLDRVCAAGADAVLIEPAHLRQTIVARLRRWES